MAITTDSLTIEVVVDDNGVIKGFKNIKGELLSFAKQTKVADNATKRLESGMDKLRASLDRVAKPIVTLNQGFELIQRTFMGVSRVVSATVGEFAKFEAQMIKVAKTVGLSDSEMNSMATSFQQISNKIPVSTAELAEFAAVAGQLGIKGSADIETFAVTMAKLTRATNLVGEEAALAMARILGLTREPAANIEQLASVVVRLGNEFKATEAQIVPIAKQLAQAGSAFGVTSTQVAGLAAAMAELGEPAELARSAVLRTFLQIQKSVALGGSELVVFQKILGMSSREIGQAFKTDAVGTFIKVLEGLRNEGENATLTLDKLGLSDIRVIKTLSTLATNLDVVKKAMATANDESQKQTALTTESDRAFDSLSSKFDIFMNVLKELGQDAGEVLAPLAEVLIDLGIGLIKLITKGAEFLAIIKDFVQLGASFSVSILDKLFGTSSQQKESRDNLSDMASIFQNDILEFFGVGVKKSKQIENNLVAVADAAESVVTPVGEISEELAKVLSEIKSVEDTLYALSTSDVSRGVRVLMDAEKQADEIELLIEKMRLMDNADQDRIFRLMAQKKLLKELAAQQAINIAIIEQSNAQQTLIALQSQIDSLGKSELETIELKRKAEEQILISKIAALKATKSQNKEAIKILEKQIELVNKTAAQKTTKAAASESTGIGSLDSIKGAFTAVGDKIPALSNAMTSASSSIGGFAGTVAGAALIILQAVKIIAQAIVAILNLIPEVIDAVAKIFTTLTDLPQKFLDAILNLGRELNRFFGDFLVNFLAALTTGIRESMAPMIRGLSQAILKATEQVPEMVLQLIAELPTIIEEMAREIGPLVGALVKGFINSAPKFAVAMFRTFTTLMPEIIIAFVRGLADGIKSIFTAEFWAGTMGNGLQQAIGGIDFGGFSGLTDSLFSVQDFGEDAPEVQAANALEEAGKKIASLLQAFIDALLDAWRWVWARLTDFVDSLVAAWAFVWEKLQFFGTWLGEVFTKAFDWLAKIINGFVDGVLKFVDGFGKFLEAMRGLVESIGAAIDENVIQPMVNAFKNVFIWIKENVWDPVVAVFKNPIGWLQDVANKIANFFNAPGWLQDFINAVSSIGGGGGGGGILSDIAGGFGFASGGPVRHLALGGAGGGVGTDTVPAMLTPGEFVMNRQASSSIGLQNLMQMNATGQAAGGGSQNFNITIAISGQQIDEDFMRNELMPTLKQELRDASNNGELILNSKGVF